jgi:hypothetical protein
MRSFLIALILLTLPFPLLAWTSLTHMEGEKGTEFKDIYGKVIHISIRSLIAKSLPVSELDELLGFGPSVEFMPSTGALWGRGTKCNPFKHQPDKSIKVQGTMVRMQVSCPTSGYNLYIFPSSKAGRKYIFNTFKTRNQVIFEADSKIFCGRFSTGSCMFKIDTSDFNVIEEEAFSGGL